MSCRLLDLEQAADCVSQQIKMAATLDAAKHMGNPRGQSLYHHAHMHVPGEAHMMVCMHVGDPHKAQLRQRLSEPFWAQRQAQLTQGSFSTIYEGAAPLKQVQVHLRMPVRC